MQSLQSDITPPGQMSTLTYPTDKLNEQYVEEFLNQCGLGHYLSVFLDEGFDSVTSLLEITEEDMIEMNVKRGHRRLIQRQISTFKGISQDQPLVMNVLSSKYPPSYAPVKYESYKPMNNGYDSVVTGLTSPRSMSSAVLSGGTSTSGNSSSADLTSSFVKGPSKKKDEQLLLTTTERGGSRSDSRSTSMSSNDDNESISTNDGSTLKRKYRRHPKPDRKAPVKPPSAYIMFSNDARAALKKQNLSFAELAKIVGDQWKNLSHCDKQNYERLAMRAKDEYLAALERYKLTPEFKQYQKYLKDFKMNQSSKAHSSARKKRVKKEQPISGSSADAGSSGNSNGSGSAGSSGSTDSLVVKRSTEPQQKKKQSNGFPDISNSSQNLQAPTSYGSNEVDNNADSSWDYRCSQMLKGIIPVEFSELSSNETNEPNYPHSPRSSNTDTLVATSDMTGKRRSPRLNGSSRSSRSSQSSDSHK